MNTSPRMRLKEVCEYLRISKSRLYKLAKEGILRKYNDGRRFVFWLRSEVEAYALIGTSKPKEDPAS